MVLWRLLVLTRLLWRIGLVLRLEYLLDLQEGNDHEYAWNDTEDETQYSPYQQPVTRLIESSLVNGIEDRSFQQEYDQDIHNCRSQEICTSCPYTKKQRNDTEDQHYEKEYEIDQLTPISVLPCFSYTSRKPWWSNAVY